MRWKRHVAHMGVMRKAYNIWSGNRQARDHWEELCIDGSIILECVIKQGRKVWTDPSVQW
jgi:hypothetical protein